MANSGQTLLSLMEVLPLTVTSTFYRSYNINIDSCFNKTMPDHTARMVQQFFAANNVNVFPWPAHSPDLSLIEHLWNHLGQRIRRRPNPPMNRNHLVQALRQTWREIPDAVIRRLINSVQYMAHACILAYDGHLLGGPI